MDFPHGETVSVLSVTPTDSGLGDTTETAVAAEWGLCAVWDRFSEESTDPQSPRVVVGKTVAGPRRSFDSDDLLVRDGGAAGRSGLTDAALRSSLAGAVLWQIDGLAQDETVNPFTGWDPGIVVNVKRAGGQ